MTAGAIVKKGRRLANNNGFSGKRLLIIPVSRVPEGILSVVSFYFGAHIFDLCRKPQAPFARQWILRPMTPNQLELLNSRRFLPLFVTQSLGAFNDNVFKNAIVFLVTFSMAQQAGINAPLMVAAAAGVFIFPFFLFSASAGQIADKYDKARLIRILKLAEIAIMVVAGLGFVLGNVWFLLAVLFLMGTQSTYFGPIKYGILPEQLRSDELIAGNAWVQTGTFIAILLGTIAGKLVLDDWGIYLISAAIIAVAVVGWVSARFIPSTGPAAPDLKVDYNPFTSTWEMLRYAAARRDIFLTILAISWFWLVGAAFLAEIAPFAKDVLGGDENLATLFLVTFSVGVALGSLFCNSMLKGQVHATFVPLGALGMTVFIVDLYFASRNGLPGGAASLSAFLDQLAGWRILIDIGLIAAAGGVYIVPLNALLQQRSEDAHRSRNIAANNIINALFMVVAAVATALLLSLGLSIPQVFLAIGLVNLAVAIYITRLLPGRIGQGLRRLAAADALSGRGDRSGEPGEGRRARGGGRQSSVFSGRRPDRRVLAAGHDLRDRHLYRQEPFHRLLPVAGPHRPGRSDQPPVHTHPDQRGQRR